MTSVYQPAQNNRHSLDNEKPNVGNGNSPLAQQISGNELKKFDTAISSLQSELDRAGVYKLEIKDQLEQVNNFGKQVAAFVKVQQSSQEQLQTLRHQCTAIANVMSQAVDIETLFNITVAEVKDKIKSDRVFIYRFTNLNSGTVLAEARTSQWTPALGETIPAVSFGLEQSQDYLEREAVVVDDIHNAKLTPYQIQLLEKFQVKSILSLPIVVDQQVWGLLVVNNCSTYHQWQESEITLLCQVKSELAKNLQRADLITQQEQQRQKEKVIAKVIDKIRSSVDVDNIFKTTTQELRQILQCDRVAVYRFDADWSGKFISESVASGWVRVVEAGVQTVWEDTHLQETKGGRYRYHENTVVDDIYQMNYSPCHVDILEQFQVKAYVIVPVFSGQKLWGLLAAYQNSATRKWQAEEVTLLQQVASNFGTIVTQAEYLAQVQVQSQQLTRTNERSSDLVSLTRKIGEALIDKIADTAQVDYIFQTATNEVRLILQADRVVIYRFNADWSGEFVGESVGKGWLPLTDKSFNKMLLADNSDCSIKEMAAYQRVKDTHLQETKGGRYQQRENCVVDDVYKQGFPDCYIELLEEFEAKAYLTVPIFKEQKLWGLFAAYQNSGTRHWEEFEVSVMTQVAVLLGAAMQQAETFAQLQQQSQQVAKVVESDRAVAKVIDKIRQSLKIETIFATTTKEVRSLLKTDRVVVFRFNPDWGGEFIAESVGNNWVRLVGPDIKTIWEDTHLQETEGGRYRQHESLIVNNLYEMGHSDCHVARLEEFQAKAYMIVPIFQGEKLWGLLAAYQNSDFRRWEDTEANLLARIGDQLGIAIQQAEYAQQLQEQAQLVANVAERDRAAVKVIDKIRQSLDIPSIFSTAVKEVRGLLNTDRVAIYRFQPDWSGLYVSESVSNGWESLLEKQQRIEGLHEGISVCTSMQNLMAGSKGATADTYLQATKGGKLRERRAFVVSDIHNAGFSPCYVEILEQYQCKAYAIVPIFQGQQLWGMLAAYENAQTREWEESEVNVLVRIGDQLGSALQQGEYTEEIQRKSAQAAKTAELERAAAKVIDRVRESQDVSSIFNTSTKEIRSLLSADRVAVYRFNADWSGLFVSESVGIGWSSLVDKQQRIERLQESISGCTGIQSLIGSSTATKAQADTYLQATQGGELRNRRTYVVPDIYKAGFSHCYIEVLEQYECRGYAIVPIFQGQKLWGMLAAYQNAGPRDWEESEVNVLARIGDQLGIALQQAEFLQQLQAQSKQLSAVAEREKAAKESLERQAMNLLSAVRPALDGDLTVRAPITEDVLGTIADAYNNTLQALRKIVTQVQTAAQQVAETSTNSDASLVGLTNLAQRQSGELAQALAQVEQMVQSTQLVATNASLVEMAVQQANQTVESGDVAMNRTVEAIQVIRDTVAQTSKKIKRLSESSQKISKVVNLIGNFATQTNVLALNAAIEATRAGEYGKGFAVVADEVRSLSRQSAAATIEIEKLVQEIQAETSEVAIAMETGIQQVVEGTNFVNETRQNLNAIVTATVQISQLLQRITEATQNQMEQSVSVTTSMQDVAEIAKQTSAESHDISDAFKELSGMAQELLVSASKFKVN